MLYIPCQHPLMSTDREGIMNTVQSAVRVYPLGARFVDIGEVEDTELHAQLLRRRGGLHENLLMILKYAWHTCAIGDELRVYFIDGIDEIPAMDEIVERCLVHYVDGVFLTECPAGESLMREPSTVVEDVNDAGLLDRLRMCAKSLIDTYERLATLQFDLGKKQKLLDRAKVAALAYAHAIP